MSTIYLTRGVMGSGKSTFAKAWVQRDAEKRVRVNRDDLRRMLYAAKDGDRLSWPQEQNVSAVETAIAKVALEKGKDVIVDAMHLRAQYIKRWYTLGYPVEFVDFEVDLDLALRRNRERGGYIPDEVVEKTFKRFTNNGILPPPPANEQLEVEPYAVDDELPWALIVDIDGTLAHIPEGGRSPYDYSRVSEDLVDESVARLVNDLSERYWIIVMSGREDSCREDTEDWLRSNNVYFDSLHMRPAGDQRKDAKVKAELFDAHVRGKYNVLGVIDDRNQVVRMWRDMGLKTYQAAYGDF